MKELWEGPLRGSMVEPAAEQALIMGWAGETYLGVLNSSIGRILVYRTKEKAEDKEG